MVAVSPWLERPDHLAPYVEILERAVAENDIDAIEEVVAAPPQHGKTVVAIHALVWWMLKRPQLWFAYCTFNQSRANSVSKQARQVAERAGLEVFGTIEQWLLPEGGGCNWKGVGSSITGEPISGFLLIDDAYSGASDANSKLVRDNITEWRVSTCEVRVHPGAGRIIMATRWHPDDESARCIAEGWHYLNLPAVAENDNDPLGRQIGEALWPSKRPLEHLQKIRRNPKIGEFVWASLYQGRPRPRGGTIFGEATWYKPSALPTSGFRIGHGLDLAYSRKTSADRSVMLTGYEHNGLIYIVDMLVYQVRADQFAPIGAAQKAKYPGPVRWYRSGTEKGTADLMELHGFEIDNDIAATDDKFVRALPASTSWNHHRILVPGSEEIDGETVPAPLWVAELLEIVQGFTGVNDSRDDEVDGLAALHDELTEPETDLSIGSAAPDRRRV